MLAYEGPDGELTLTPSLAQVCAFLDRGADYWEGGSGSALLAEVELREPGYQMFFDRPVLHLIGHPPYGFCLVYALPDRRYVTDNEAAPDSPPIKHYCGGEPEFFPLRHFISRELTEQAIAHFLETQQPTPAVRWKPHLR